MKRELRELMNNPGYKALWEKARNGFRYVSGDGWETRANYINYWTLADDLYRMAYGPKAVLPVALKGALIILAGGHIGEIRKGPRKRPYFHHPFMVLYLTWILYLPLSHQMAAISHDDLEDIPDNIGVPVELIELVLLHFSGEEAVNTVRNLTNDDVPREQKHAMQLKKMASIPLLDALLKLLDKIANLYDCRKDRPKSFDRPRIRQECIEAEALADAMPIPAPDPVLALLAFSIDLLARENDLTFETA